MYGIEGDDRAVDGNRIEQLFDHGDFIGGRGDEFLGHDGCFTMEKCCEKVRLASVLSACSLEGFPVHCHGRIGSHGGFHPAGDGRVHCLSIE